MPKEQRRRAPGLISKSEGEMQSCRNEGGIKFMGRAVKFIGLSTERVKGQTGASVGSSVVSGHRSSVCFELVDIQVQRRSEGAAFVRRWWSVRRF